jgi:hypothetical protein
MRGTTCRRTCRPCWPALAYQDAGEALLRYSLVDITESRLQVHRLVQTVVRDSLPNDESWPKAALSLLRHSLHIDYDDPRTASTAVPLVPHALTVVEYAEQNETELEAASWLLDRLATGAQCRGSLVSARDLMQRAALAHDWWTPEIGFRRRVWFGVLLRIRQVFGIRVSDEFALSCRRFRCTGRRFVWLG